MPCLYPRTVGFKSDGKTLAWSPKQASKEFAPLQLPCSKCIECRLEYARQWAVRCTHEAQMHEKNSFITLTYDDQHLKSDRLIYADFQKFMKKLRKLQNDPMGVFVTGEYGDLTKRPHWHAIIFNWYPNDAIPSHKTPRGDQVYTSETLQKTWGHGFAELGSVTFESAGYCARYAVKKLSHGRDSDHSYHPVSRKSSKHAIGKRWLEKFWPDIFNNGTTVIRNDVTTGVPRYYTKWLAQHQPAAYERWITETRETKIQKAIQKQSDEEKRYVTVNGNNPRRKTQNQVRAIILKNKIKQLKNRLR